MHSLRLTLLLVLGFSSAAHADFMAGFAEYRALDKLGQVRLTYGAMHVTGDSPEAQAKWLKSTEAETAGIFSLSLNPGDEEKTYQRKAKAGDREIEIQLQAFPARGNGPGGAISKSRIVVKIDDAKRMDCWFQDVGGTDLEIEDITIQFDLMIVAYSVDGKRFSHTLWIDGSSLDSKEVFSDQLVKSEISS